MSFESILWNKVWTDSHIWIKLPTFLLLKFKSETFSVLTPLYLNDFERIWDTKIVSFGISIKSIAIFILLHYLCSAKSLHKYCEYALANPTPFSLSPIKMLRNGSRAQRWNHSRRNAFFSAHWSMPKWNHYSFIDFHSISTAALSQVFLN